MKGPVGQGRALARHVISKRSGSETSVVIAKQTDLSVSQTTVCKTTG